MAKIFGGSASRVEVYALFVAAVVLIGGGIGGAIVVSSDDTPSVQQEATADLSTALSVPVGDVSTPQAESSPIPTVSVPGLTREQASALQALIERESESQRIERLEQERRSFALAHPAARFNSADVLSCTSVPVFDSANPTRLVEEIQLVEYRLTYEVFYPLHPGSYVNPGLSVYQGDREQLLGAVAGNWSTQPTHVPLKLATGSHSMVLYGFLFPSGGPPYIDVQLGSNDPVYGGVNVNLPLPKPVCS